MSLMNTDFRADLHTHSSCSDGSDHPKELVNKAIELKLSGLSITDHDTISAYSEVLDYAKERDFPLLSGIEFSASHKGLPVDILGYAFSLKSESIRSLCERHQKRRKERNLGVLRKLKTLGISIGEEELYSLGLKTIGRPHIALILVQLGVVSSVNEAFIKYLGDGKSAYVAGEKISCEETIACIHQGGGKAILAHPHLIKRSNLRREVLKYPFDGLEGYYARIPKEQEKKWIIAAKERRWLITGGSDYHGAIKPHNFLGSSWVGRETFSHLYDHFLSHD